MKKTWEQLSAIQPIGVKMLMNSIAKERISHAYLLEGGKEQGSLQQRFKWQRVSSALKGMR